MKTHLLTNHPFLIAVLAVLGALNLANAQMTSPIAPPANAPTTPPTTPTNPPLSPVQTHYEVTKRLTSERSTASVVRTEKTMVNKGEALVDVLVKYERVLDPTSPTGDRNVPIYEKRVVPVIQWVTTASEEVKARPILHSFVVDPDGTEGATPPSTSSVYLYHAATFRVPLPSTSNRTYSYDWRESPGPR